MGNSEEAPKIKAMPILFAEMHANPVFEDELIADLSVHLLFQSAIKPEFEKCSRVHDWRNYITESMRAKWPEMSLDARMVAVYMAEEQAHTEDWD